MSNWFIKKTDSTLFGPVDEAKLKAWAAQGRIAPDDLVSKDRENWQPAPDLDLLEMNWTVHLKSGKTYGPIHAMALCDLVDDRTLFSHDKLSHKTKGETTTVGDVLLTSLLGERDAYSARATQPAVDTSTAQEVKELRAALQLLQSEMKSVKAEKQAAPDGAKASADVEERISTLSSRQDEDSEKVKQIGEMILKVKDHLEGGKETQQAAARALDALERMRKEKALLEQRVGSLEAAIEEIVATQSTAPVRAGLSHSGDELARLRDESLTKIRQVEESVQTLFRDRRNQEVDIRQVRDEVDKLKRVYEEEHRISVQREAELAELVEQLQHEKEAVLIALQQARGRRRIHQPTSMEPAEPAEAPKASDTRAGDEPAQATPPKTTMKRGIMVTRISRDSIR